MEGIQRRSVYCESGKVEKVEKWNLRCFGKDHRQLARFLKQRGITCPRVTVGVCVESCPCRVSSLHFLLTCPLLHFSTFPLSRTGSSPLTRLAPPVEASSSARRAGPRREGASSLLADANR